MPYNREHLKLEAKSKIKGNVFTVLLGLIITAILLGPINAVPGFGQLVMIALMVVEIGAAKFMLTFIDIGKTNYEDIFFSFTRKDINIYFKHLGMVLIRLLLIILWSLLLIVPGIIKALAYSQATYIMAENPDKEMMDCLKESEKLMNGRKMDLFVLSLSFLGWFILSGLTFGILLIYVMPYYATSQALFYRFLRPLPTSESEQKDSEPIIS